MTAAEVPLDLAASLTEALAPDGGHVDVAAELALPDWDEEVAEGEEEPERRRWRVDSDERADYALRRVMLEDEQVAQVRALADAQKRQIDAWVAKRIRPHEEARAFFLGSAIDYARRLRMAEPAFRSLPLPCGWTLTAHDGRAGVDVPDGDVFCAWALEQEHDDVVNVTMKPKLREVAKRYRADEARGVFVDPETGEAVPGLVPRSKGWKADAKPPAAGPAAEDDDTD